MPKLGEFAAIGLIAGIGLLTACNDRLPSDAARSELEPVISTLPTSVPTPVPTPVMTSVVLPSHNYDERRGETYYYIAAVSEEDRQRGVAVGTVSAFQYLGRNDAGEHILAAMNDDGSVVYRAKCSDACKIIDTDYGRKIAYSTRSIIGAAFADAFQGRLRVASWSRDVAVAQAPPVALPSEPPAEPGQTTPFVHPESAPQSTLPSVETARTPAPLLIGDEE